MKTRTLTELLRILTGGLAIVIVSIIAISSIIATTGAISTNAPPAGDIWFNVQTNSNVKTPRMRAVGGSIVLDPDVAKWEFRIMVELWKTNGERRVVDSELVALTLTQLKAVANSPNPLNALKAAAFNAMNATEAP